MRYGFSDDPVADRAHYDVIRRLTTTQRARQGMLLSGWNREMTLGHIREDHPAYTDEDVRLTYCRQIMTDDEFATLFPEHACRFPKARE